jgi:hypothetical protein
MSRPTDAEYTPLPYFPWLSRPETVPLDEEECATAIYLAEGRLDHAAALLKVEPKQLRKAIRRYARLRLLLTRLGASPDAAVTSQDGQVGGVR